MGLRFSSSGAVFASFWIFGLINNVLYVVILSAAVDLVGPEAPKAVVLLADVLPSFFIKLTAPFYIHMFPYSLRIAALIALSFCGMLIIASFDSIALRLFGIVLASLSSGAGEISFLALTHYYDEWALTGFSSGTGAAGLVGSFVFMVMTTWMRLSVTTSLVIFSLAPWLFAVTYAYLLPVSDKAVVKYQALQTLGTPRAISPPPMSLSSIDFDGTVRRIKPLIVPFMIPLMVVYIGEYIINQGISPTLLFPLDELPFSRFRDVYVAYGTLYQRKYSPPRPLGWFQSV